MEWKFGFVLKRQLPFIGGLLPMLMGIGCQTDAPIYEPSPIMPIGARPPSNIDQKKRPTQAIPNDDTLSHNPSSNPPNDVAIVLKNIGWSDLITSWSDLVTKWPDLLSRKLIYLQNLGNKVLVLYMDPSDGPYEANFDKLPNRLMMIPPPSNPEFNLSAKGRAGIASITLRSNLRNVGEHLYALIGFWVKISKTPHSASTEHSIAFFQSKTKWYYDNDGNKTPIATEEAIRLASESGLFFFYQKIR